MTKKIRIFAVFWMVFVSAPLNIILFYKLFKFIHAPSTVWTVFWICQASSFLYGSIIQLLSEKKQ